MDVGAIDGDFDADGFQFEEVYKSISNGHSFEVLSGERRSPDYRMVFAMQRPSQGSLKGSYSEQEGFKLEAELTWTNEPSPPAKEKEQARDKEETAQDNNEASRKDSSQEGKKSNE